MKWILLCMLTANCPAQLLHRLDFRLDFTSAVTATTFFAAAVTQFNPVTDTSDPDNRYRPLTLTTNGGGNYTVSGSLMLASSNKIWPVWNALTTSGKPANTSAFIEWHKCPREGDQRGLAWKGCVTDPRAFYRKTNW